MFKPKPWLSPFMNTAPVNIGIWFTYEWPRVSTSQVNDLTRQVVKAARIVLLAPGNNVVEAHFDGLKEKWTNNMEKLLRLVDEPTDTVGFIKACGKCWINSGKGVARSK